VKDIGFGQDRGKRRHAAIRNLLRGSVCVLGLVAVAPAMAVCPSFGLPSGSEIAELETSEGSICIELFRSAAPVTVQNFVDYITSRSYDGTLIHRSVPGFVIQGGAFETTSDSLSVVPTDPPIPNEPCTIEPGQSVCTTRGNERGTVAMARQGSQVDSATNPFYIHLSDNRVPLDTTYEGYTVFGEVLGTGMAVVDEIAALPIVPPDEAWWLAPELGGALGELPARNPVALFQTAFGCWDPTNLAVVVDPLNHLAALPDPIYTNTLYPLSGSCGTQIPRFTFTEDPGPPSCPDNDVLSTGVTGMNSLLIRFDPATSDYLQFEFRCEDVSEALMQRSLWRADYGARLAPELVVIESARYQPVPEPDFAVALLLGVLVLVGIAPRRLTVR
jgi:cyclophilin family peptidyl-prolyl cis-trans isomerase